MGQRRAFQEPTNVATAPVAGSSAGAHSWTVPCSHGIKVGNQTGDTVYINVAGEGDTATAATATASDWEVPAGQTHLLRPSDFDLNNIEALSEWCPTGATVGGLTIAGA